MHRNNHALLMERFPVLGLQVASWENLKAEAESPEKRSLDNVKLLYIYGLGEAAGYAQFRSWLRQDPERKLVFLEDVPGHIASFLERPQAKKVLSDEQVFLECISSGPKRIQEIEAMVAKYPVRNVEVVPLPSRKGRRFQALRLCILRKTTLAYGFYYDRIQAHHPFYNFVRNVQLLPQSFYANRMKGTFANIPAIVCGAGPSLSSAIELLRKYEDRVLIIAGGSTLAALSSQGIRPHFGMAIDPNEEEYSRFRNSFAFETPLLYCTRVFPKISQTCNGPFGYMRTGLGGMPELWMDEELGLTERLLGDHLNEETMAVTAICLAWAEFLGCNPIFLSGVDLAYTNNRRYAPGVIAETPFEQQEASDCLYKRKDRLGRPIYTAVRWLMESASMSHFVKKHPKTTFINTTEGGLGFKHIPYQPLSAMLEQHCTQKLQLRKRVAEAIFASPMPKETAKITKEKIGALKESLDRIVAHLEVLWKEKSEGKRALAEVELQEEMAYPYLFYDAEKLYGEKDNKWELMYRQAFLYRKAFKTPHI